MNPSPINPTLTDEMFMRRALQLAACGRQFASPNPMVGAVIVRHGEIIGEGYHRRCGEGHAEVNAVASVADKSLLLDSTIYVTLEPCSHWGKTPPCAKLLIDSAIPRCVIGSLDPFEKVAGRGVRMLREAGVFVRVGVLEEECRRLNTRFMTAHTLHRPYITLKWAQSLDGYMDSNRAEGEGAYRFSTALSSLLTARLRSLNDAILTTSATVMADNPRLNVRGWSGNNPIPVVIDRNSLLDTDLYRVFGDNRTIHITGDCQLEDVFKRLYDRGVTSVLVEAGPRLLNTLIAEDLWDEARVEVAPVRLGNLGTHQAPRLSTTPYLIERLGPNIFYHYRRSH